MICFVAGLPPDTPNLEERMGLFIEAVSEYEGLVEIRGNTLHPNKVLLCFRDQESATAAQWMMELNGSKPTKRDEEIDEPAGTAERKTDGTLPEPEGGRADHGDLSGSGPGEDARDARMPERRQREERDTAGAGERAGDLGGQPGDRDGEA